MWALKDKTTGKFYKNKKFNTREEARFAARSFNGQYSVVRWTEPVSDTFVDRTVTSKKSFSSKPIVSAFSTKLKPHPFGFGIEQSFSITKSRGF